MTHRFRPDRRAAGAGLIAAAAVLSFRGKRLRYRISRAASVPRAARPIDVPEKYLHLEGKHDDHPGPGKGPKPRPAIDEQP